jgi:hydroxypyruvate isomerase
VKYAVNCSILFKELPLLERPAAARQAGFEAVEFWWPFDQATPDAKELAQFAKAIEAADVQLIGLNLFAGDMSLGERGLVSWVSRRDEFKANLPVALKLGQDLGCRSFNALYGVRQPGEDPAEADRVALANLVSAAEAAAGFGGQILLEPISGAAGYPFLTADDVADVIVQGRAAGAGDNLTFLCDLYHLAANGDDLTAAIRDHADLIGHVQIADAPGRGQPGAGSLPLGEHLAQLAGVGYDGWVALEYNPTGPTADSFGALPPLP